MAVLKSKRSPAPRSLCPPLYEIQSEWMAKGDGFYLFFILVYLEAFGKLQPKGGLPAKRGLSLLSAAVFVFVGLWEGPVMLPK